MSRDPDHFVYMSLCLSEVLGGIGVNEGMVIRLRRAYFLREALTTLSHRARGIQQTNYLFGSVTEGATTLGLRSDNDYFIFDDNLSEVISDLKDCKAGKLNYVMTENEFTPKGYCYLRIIFGNNPDNSATELFSDHWTSIPVFWKSNDGDEYELHGPAFSSKGETTYNDQDYVIAYYCKTWPKSAKKWLTEEGIGQWPTKEMKSFAEHSGCFIVPVGRKGSKMEKYEYRISTALAERCLMLSLNITQLRCYVLMKMILKHLSTLREKMLSSQAIFVKMSSFIA